MKFKVMPRNSSRWPLFKNHVLLYVDNWNDHSFYTMFRMKFYSESGSVIDIGNIKIGFIGQEEDEKTNDALQKDFNGEFENLSDKYFSIGEDLEFYKKIREAFSDDDGNELLNGIKDLAILPHIPEEVSSQRVFSISLLRNLSITSIEGQYKRVLNRLAPLTDYNFIYRRKPSENLSEVSIDFDVLSNSNPSTNVHAVIGRNGIGKTTILNDMIGCVLSLNPNDMFSMELTEPRSGFYDGRYFKNRLIDNHFFSGVISVSFSAFDPFTPPLERNESSKGPFYYYIGLKSHEGGRNKELSHLHSEFKESISQCFRTNSKRELWLRFISYLEPSSNENMSTLINEIHYDGANFHYSEKFEDVLAHLSSGHAIVLFTLTKLIDKCEEKTLVLIDEPESHLHPPLLSAFIRSLSELLDIRNGVAIIATHSPVVLQEIPSTCVNKITRVQSAMSVSRPEIQTFGENVGVLTRDIFGLEITKTGFHKILSDDVENGLSFEQIIHKYNGNLGFEAQAIVRVLVSNKGDDKN